MEHVPEYLRIKIIYKDDNIIVIDKPCNLRSVPGHANPPPSPSVVNSTARAKSHKENRLTSQEAWTRAILSFQNQDITDVASKWLSGLSKTGNLSSIPRKWGQFRRYVIRNQCRLNQIHAVDKTEMDEIASEMYERVRKRQVPLMNLPEATSHEQSAFGQLILMGYANANDESLEVPNCRKDEMSLYVVHRLDCQVSRIEFHGFQVVCISAPSG